MTQAPNYPPLAAGGTGIKGKCPRCGQGNLFDGYLSVADSCKVCGLSYEFAEAGDGPAWFIMLIVGLVVVIGAFAVEMAYMPPYWVHAVIWLPVTLLLAILPLRPLKGLMIARQYQTDARVGQAY